MARRKKHQRPFRAYLRAGEGRGEMGVPTFRVVCKDGSQAAIGFAMPKLSSDEEGETLACLDAFQGKGKGCRSFPSRRMAIAWLSGAAKDWKC